jgi:hypothetical protein
MRRWIATGSVTTYGYKSCEQCEGFNPDTDDNPACWDGNGTQHVEVFTTVNKWPVRMKRTNKVSQ